MKGHHHIFTNFWMWLMSFFETYHWSLPRFQLASNPILKSALTGALKVTLHCTTRTEKVHLKIKAHLARIFCKRKFILRLKYKFSISERSDFITYLGGILGGSLTTFFSVEPRRERVSSQNVNSDSSWRWKSSPESEKYPYIWFSKLLLWYSNAIGFIVTILQC